TIQHTGSTASITREGRCGSPLFLIVKVLLDADASRTTTVGIKKSAFGIQTLHRGPLITPALLGRRVALEVVDEILTVVRARTIVRGPDAASVDVVVMRVLLRAVALRK